jgi:hypothetical protein
MTSGRESWLADDAEDDQVARAGLGVMNLVA